MAGGLPGLTMPGGAPQDERRRHDDDDAPDRHSPGPPPRTPSVSSWTTSSSPSEPTTPPTGTPSRTPAGRTLLALATLARRAAGALGADPGVALLGGPGIVVQRELAAAARLLDEAADAAPAEPWEIDDLLVAAQRLRARLMETLAAA